MKRQVALLCALLVLIAGCKSPQVQQTVSRKNDYQQAYIYGFPMIAG
jgi:hypothetical protein